MKKLLAILALIAGLLPSAALAQASPSAFTTGYRYDAAHRLTGTIEPDPDGAGPLAYAAVRNTYDAAGRLTRVEKGELASWQSEAVAPASWSGFTVFETVDTVYDALDRKVSETQSAGGTAVSLSQTSYDNVGRVDCVAVRMNAAAFASAPGACSLGTQGSYGPDRITHNVYDAASEILKVQKAYGVTTANGFPATLQQDYVTYEYTSDGKQQAVIDANGNRAEGAPGVNTSSAVASPNATPTLNGAGIDTSLSNASARDPNVATETQQRLGDRVGGRGGFNWGLLGLAGLLGLLGLRSGRRG